MINVLRGDEADPRRLGQLLLVACGATTVIATPVLATDNGARLTLALVSLGMVLALAVTECLPKHWWTRRRLLIFPALVLTALCVSTVLSPALVAPLVGMITFCFAYIGLTQPAGASLIMSVPAAGTFVYANDTWTRAIATRLVIAVVVWVLLAELLASMTSRQRALHAALHAAAHTDALTGVANRRDLQMRLTTTAAGDAIVVLDLDHFKRLNDTEGHAFGDRVLADFGATLRLTLRTDDYCARFGGEEFVVILHRTQPAQAVAIVERIRSTWRTLQPAATFSAGIAVCTGDRDTAETMSAADRAVYAAKAAGRDCIRLEPATATV